MRISGIQADSFGAWSHLELDDLSLEVTVFYGPNEAGKSTLLQFIRTILYGFGDPDAQKYLPPLDGRPAAGTLTVMAPNGHFNIKRLAADQFDEGEDELSVRAVDGSMQGAHLLDSMLSGIDRSIFNNVFAVGLSELQQLATLSDTAAAQLLYGLASGADRVSLFEVASEVRSARQRLLDPERKCGVIRELLQRRTDLRKQINQSSGSSQRWNALVEQSADIDREIRQLENLLGPLNNGSYDENALLQKWHRCQEVHRKIRQLGPGGDVPTAVITQLQELTDRIARLKQKWEGLSEQQEQLGLPKPSRIRHWLTSQLRSILRRREEIIQMDQRAQQLESDADEIEFEIQAEVERLGLSNDFELTDLPDIRPETLAQLKQPARRVRDARKRFDAAKQLVESQATETDRIRNHLDATLTEHGVLDINDAVERAGQRVSQLRRRLQLDERQTQIAAHIEELELEETELLRRQVLPWPLLVFFGILFSFGFLLFGVGLFGQVFSLASANSWLVMLIGMAMGVATLVMKNVVEYSATSRLETIDRKNDSVRAQRKKLLEEAAEIDQCLPPSDIPLTSQLEAAEVELADLEELMPLQRQRSNVSRDRDAVRNDEQLAASDYKLARSKWNRLLTQLQLPANLTPKKIKMLADSSLQQNGLQEKLLQTRQERSRLHKNLAKTRTEIYEALISAEIAPGEANLESQLEQLATAAGLGESSSQNRGAKKQYEKLAAEKRKFLAKARQLKAQRRSLAGDYGVFTKRQFEKLLGSADQLHALSSERNELVDQLTSSLQNSFTPQELLDHAYDDESVLERIEVLSARSRENEKRLKRLLERRGALTEQLKTLGNSNALQESRLELNCVEAQLNQAAQEYRELTLTGYVLDDVRRSYETERQPETLAEASGYLQRLTEGRYTRIWTPFGESALCVDLDDGSSFAHGETQSRNSRAGLPQLALCPGGRLRSTGLPLADHSGRRVRQFRHAPGSSRGRAGKGHGGTGHPVTGIHLP